MSHKTPPPTTVPSKANEKGEFHYHGDPMLKAVLHHDREPTLTSAGEFHCHGDPVLEAVLKYDTMKDEAERRKAIQKIYDEHAKMLGEERSGVFLGDHTMFYQDFLPEK